MVPAEDNEQGTRSGWDKSKTVLAVGIRVEQTATLLLVPDLVLSILAETIERGKVEVRGGVVLRPVDRIGAEKRVCHNRREGKGQRRVATRMRLELNAYIIRYKVSIE